MNISEEYDEQPWTDSFVKSFYQFLTEKVIHIAFIIFSLVIVSLVYKYVIRPVIYPLYKTILCYKSLLSVIKKELEKGIPEELYFNKEVTNSYFELYAAYRDLRRTAKTDFDGRIDHTDHQWDKYYNVNLPTNIKMRRFV